MKIKHRRTSLLLSTLFTSTFLSTAATAQLVPDGYYTIAINPTPKLIEIPGLFIPDPGTDGAWNTTFTLVDVPSYRSYALTDNNILVDTNGGLKGSPHGGDGFAGTIAIKVTGNTFSALSFQVDTIEAGGAMDHVAQYAYNQSMSGTIDQSTGQMTFTPTGRLAAIDFVLSNDYFDLPFNAITETSWAALTTGTTLATPRIPPITGAPVTNIGDINGDGQPDFSAILVSTSTVGAEWKGWDGLEYSETWNVTIFSGTDIAVLPKPDVSINIDGEATQECNNVGGNYINVSADVIIPPAMSIETITWMLDDSLIATGSSASIFIPLGNHTLKAEVVTTDGIPGSESIDVVVQDTTPPALDVALLDSRSGEPITAIDRPNVQWIKTKYSATDVCDASPSTSGFGGFAVADGDTLKVQGKLNTVTLTTSIIELSATAEDASGNTASGKATLNIAD